MKIVNELSSDGAKRNRLLYLKLMYTQVKNLMFAQIFAFFSKKIDSLTLNVMITSCFAQMFAFFSNIIDSLTLKVMTIPYFAQFFAFFSNKIDSLTSQICMIKNICF